MNKYENVMIPSIDSGFKSFNRVISERIIDFVTSKKTLNEQHCIISAIGDHLDEAFDCGNIDCCDCIFSPKNYKTLKKYLKEKYKVDAQLKFTKTTKKMEEKAQPEEAEPESKYELFDMEKLTAHQVVRCEKDGRVTWMIMINDDGYAVTITPVLLRERQSEIFGINLTQIQSVAIGKHFRFGQEFDAENITHVFCPNCTGNYFDGIVLNDLIQNHKTHINEHWLKIYERAMIVTIEDIFKKFGCPVIIKQ